MKKKFEENYQEVRQKFDNAGGILEPIRAFVHVYDECKDMFAEIAKVSVYGTESFDYFKNHSHIIGYFAAIKDDKGEVHIGISICDPSDFDIKKDNRISQLTAISSAKNVANQQPMSLLLGVTEDEECSNEVMKKAIEKMWLTKSHNGYFARVMRYSHVHSGNIFYNFASLTLGNQLAYFIERCQRYFYPANDNATAEN